ncbi:MAG: hypothetical protein QOI01_7176 [Mycobacterium sp.]|jgi:hypothetical protein|nr:hypothetical protein [Mycobacterium sp.]
MSSTVGIGNSDRLLHRLVGDGVLPAAYATDVGAGLLYRGTEFAAAVCEYDGAAAYFIDNQGWRSRRDAARH